MGLKQTHFFSNSSYEAEDTQIIICRTCSSHLCLSSLILSDNFVGSSGPAYLVDKLINYHPDSEAVETNMRTGTYLICNVRCHQCSTKLGWVYRKAYEDQESYKEGKFVIEEKFIKTIANNSSTATLLENMKRNRRRSSAANSVKSSSFSSENEDDSFRFENPSPTHSIGNKPRINHLTFHTESDESFLSRLRFRNLDEKLEDIEDEAIVD
ncbi:hypothetical protein CLIB1423_15S00452 [[Candida] railenensis]|uniref:Yippee domain-containing protein n=1 Tax=[Candida] railenensis TaxID=45579 RepID=A0A9P0QTB3_9ASCO|nr:hypothetical protein CLIB1423_15S00452 [[Candida] railenensis]